MHQGKAFSSGFQKFSFRIYRFLLLLYIYREKDDEYKPQSNLKQIRNICNPVKSSITYTLRKKKVPDQSVKIFWNLHLALFTFPLVRRGRGEECAAAVCQQERITSSDFLFSVNASRQSAWYGLQG